MTNKKLKLELEIKGFEVFKSAAAFIDAWAEKSTLSKHLKGVSGEIITLNEIFAETAIHIIPTMNKLQEYNEKIFEAEQKANTLRIKNVDTEIEGLNKTARTVESVIKKYNEKEEALKKQAKEIKKQYEKTLQEEIKAAEGNEEKIMQIKLRLAERLEGVDNGMQQSVKNNYQERAKAIDELVSNSVKQYTNLYEKKRSLLVEDAEQQRQQMKLLYEKAIEEAKTDEEKLRLKEALNRNLLVIDEDLNNKLKENAQKQMEETSAMVDKSMASITETIKENKKNGLGLIDYKKTKENLEEVKKQLNDYKALLEQARLDSLKYYSELEKQYAGDAEKLKQIQDEKSKSMAMFAKENEKIEKAITETSKKESGLRMEQTKEAFSKAAEHLKTANETIKKHFEAGLKALDDIGILDANTKKYDEQLNKLKEEEDALAKKRKNNSDELSWLRDKEEKQGATLTDAEKQRMKDLQKSIDDDLRRKKEIEKEKEKAEKEREKAEKNRQKLELVRKIIVSTADVAAAVTKALTAGPFIGIAQAAITAAVGAFNIGKMTAALSKMEQGGLLRGKRHTQGGMRIEGTNIEVEGGEYVINRESTNKNLGLIRYINSQRRELKPQHINSFFATPTPRLHRPEYMRMFESGGQVPSMPMSPDVDAQILRAIERINFQPHVSVTDINNVQQQMVKTHDWIGI